MRRFVALLAMLVLVACSRGSGITSPTALPATVSEWSPYLGVHGYSSHENIQQPYLLPLLRSGSVRGIRVDMDEFGGPDFARFALENGARDVLGIFSNEHLHQSGVDAWEELEFKMSENPGIRYWEIGNEVSTLAGIKPSRYLSIFLLLQKKAQVAFPENVLIPQAPVGSGDSAREFEYLLDHGLLDLAHKKELPVVSLHFYAIGSFFLYDIKRQVERLPGSTEVWVTETGVDDQSQHLEYVQTHYPRLREQWRATRIYWYVFSECTQLSLVMGLPPPCRREEPKASPLYRALVGDAP